MQVVYNNVRCIMEKQGILDEESNGNKSGERKKKKKKGK